MAFIVPVMKKDFILYNADRRKDRANSNPVEIRTHKNDNNNTPKLTRLSCSVDIVGPSQSVSSAPTTPVRRRNHRILIRRINSESEGLDCPQSAPPNMDSQRHVRFGFLEEIQYNENDEQFIDNEPYTPTKKVSIHPCIKMANRPCALEATTPTFKKNAMLKLVTFCSKN